jgi:phosphotransferase system enzyme I (PtsI)
MHDEDRLVETQNRLTGKIISPGVALGYAHFEESLPLVTFSRIEPESVPHELSRLATAVELVRQHLEEHIREFHDPSDEDFQQVFSLHMLMLEDQKFFSSIARRIEKDLFSAEYAVEVEFGAAADRLRASKDLYMQARAEDLRDICQIVKKALLLKKAAFSPLDTGREAPIFIAVHLQPSTVIRAKKTGAVAFITASEAFSSHGAILLRSSCIPALGRVAITEAPFNEGTQLLVDAIRGEIHVQPSEEVQSTAFAVAAQMKQPDVSQSLPPLNVRTADGIEVALWANIDHPSQTALCFHHRLRGIGLFRTEFLVLENGRIPDEEEQYHTYRHVVELLNGRPLVLRTFDIGADKVTTALHKCTGPNPALGIRGLRRHLLRFQEELRTQLKAILRAAVNAEVAILLPMVTHAEDVRAARVQLDKVNADLEREGIPFKRNVRVGAMIEVPSAAIEIAELLQTVDFVSIGTNDLLQYLTASDRDNPDVIPYQRLEGSGLIFLLKHIVEQARRIGRDQDVFVCGEIASDPEIAKLLVQIGIMSLSISPSCAPAVRRAIENTHTSRREEE